MQPFGHNTPMSQTNRTGNGPIAYGKLFYKWSPENYTNYTLTMHEKLKLTDGDPNTTYNIQSIYILAETELCHNSASALLHHCVMCSFVQE